MQGLEKYARNWATRKTGQPIWKLFFALFWSTPKKPTWDFLHIFKILAYDWHTKDFQLMKIFFLVYHGMVCTINLPFIEGKCLLFAKNRLNKNSAKSFCISAFGEGLQGKIYEPNTTPP